MMSWTWLASVAPVYIISCTNLFLPFIDKNQTNMAAVWEAPMPGKKKKRRSFCCRNINRTAINSLCVERVAQIASRPALFLYLGSLLISLLISVHTFWLETHYFKPTYDPNHPAWTKTSRMHSHAVPTVIVAVLIVGSWPLQDVYNVHDMSGK